MHAAAAGLSAAPPSAPRASAPSSPMTPRYRWTEPLITNDARRFRHRGQRASRIRAAEETEVLPRLLRNRSAALAEAEEGSVLLAVVPRQHELTTRPRPLPDSVISGGCQAPALPWLNA